jgi:hypothetical protein
MGDVVYGVLTGTRDQKAIEKLLVSKFLLGGPWLT